MSRRLLVLGWHNVEPTWAFSGASPEAGRRNLERQIRQLRRWATVVPLRSALADLAAGRPLPPRAVALTFDDGYLDNVTVAAPMLAAAGLPATFFLVPGFLSATAQAWWEELGWAFVHATVPQVRWGEQDLDTSSAPARQAALAAVSESLKGIDGQQRWAAVEELRARLRPEGPPAERLFMDWDEARGLLDHGHDIQSHTCTHPILSRELPEAQAREIGQSRRDLESSFGRPVDVLAYPNGGERDYSEVTLRAVAESGYAYAVTTREAAARPGTRQHEVPRLVLDPGIQGARLLKRTVRAALA